MDGEIIAVVSFDGERGADHAHAAVHGVDMEHTEICEAIRDRDADRAEICIKKHIHNVRDVFEQYYALLF